MKSNNIIYKNLETYRKIPEKTTSKLSLMQNYLSRQVSKGMNINRSQDPINGDTLLHRAVREGKINIAKAILANGGNPELTNLTGKTAITLAKQQSPMIQSLFEKYVTSQKVNKKSFSIIKKEFFSSLEVRFTKNDMLKFKKVGGSRLLFSCDTDFRSALHRAAALGDANLIKFLIFEGLDMNKKDRLGRIPLFHAASEGQKDATIYLLKNGGGRNNCDTRGQTPIHLAAKHGHLEIVKLLAFSFDGKHLSSAVNKKDNSGRLPIDLAKEHNSTNVVSYLASLKH